MEQEQYYYTKYLKYKAKYLNLIKLNGGNAEKPIIYTKETLINEIIEFTKKNYSLKKYCGNDNCSNSNSKDRIKNINYNYKFYQNNLCVFAEYDDNYGDIKFYKMYIGELISNEDRFNAYGDTQPSMEFSCMNLYEKKNTRSNFNDRPFNKTIQFNSSVVFFIGFIEKKYKNEILSEATRIREDIWKTKTSL
jgi:hypothetical protein